VHAVDSAVGPEIQKHYFTVELFKSDGSVSVDPVQPLGEFGSMNGSRWIRLLHGNTLLKIVTVSLRYILKWWIRTALFSHEGGCGGMWQP
jgi:hypothetical protein